MIRVDRSSISAPTVLATDRTMAARSEARDAFRSEAPESRQTNFDFDAALLQDNSVVSALATLFNSRCAFCSLIWTPETLSVRHFRPPQFAVNADGSSSRQHYYWLAYEWSNLYPVCDECYAAKGSKFPVDGPRALPETLGQTLVDERPSLLDPSHDDPEMLFAYLPTGQVVTQDTRGRATIDTLSLNRPSLVAERKRVAQETIIAFQGAIAEIGRGNHTSAASIVLGLVDPTKALAAVRRQYANARIHYRIRQLETAFNEAGYADPPLAITGHLPRLTAASLRQIASEYFERPSSDLPRDNRYSEHSWALATVGAEDAEHRPLETAGISEIRIKNFRGIDELHLDLGAGAGAGDWLMLLGENGAGKTTVLQAVAIALADDRDLLQTRLTPARLLRPQTRSGFVEVTLSGSGARVGREFSRGSHPRTIGRHAGFAVYAYGATRLLPSPGQRGSRMRTLGVGNLFDPRLTLPGTRSWIPRLTDYEFDSVARTLRRLLLLDGADDQIVRNTQGQIQILRQGRRIGLTTLSEGYRAMAALSLDLMRSFLRQWDSLEVAEGLVVVDEIGAHLHPRWQMRVVDALRSAFPRVQFLASSHDPLCLRGLRDGEVLLLRRSTSGRFISTRDLPPIEGITVDQILTSEHFGLYSTVDPALESAFEEYYEILGSAAESTESDRVGELRRLFERRKLMGQTRRERLLLEAADEFIASEMAASSAQELQSLHAEARERLRSIWLQGIQ
jgi:uncharacterized protein (TIGR02646 family)